MKYYIAIFNEPIFDKGELTDSYKIVAANTISITSPYSIDEIFNWLQNRFIGHKFIVYQTISYRPKF